MTAEHGDNDTSDDGDVEKFDFVLGKRLLEVEELEYILLESAVIRVVVAALRVLEVLVAFTVYSLVRRQVHRCMVQLSTWTQ